MIGFIRGENRSTRNMQTLAVALIPQLHFGSVQSVTMYSSWLHALAVLPFPFYGKKQS
jgi:hypothetical protein